MPPPSNEQALPTRPRPLFGGDSGLECEAATKRRRTSVDAPLVRHDMAALSQSLRTSGAADKRVREVPTCRTPPLPLPAGLWRANGERTVESFRVQFRDDLNSLPLEQGNHALLRAHSQGEGLPYPVEASPLTTTDAAISPLTGDVSKPTLTAADWARVRNTMVKQQAIFTEQMAQLHSLVKAQTALAKQGSAVDLQRWQSLPSHVHKLGKTESGGAPAAAKHLSTSEAACPSLPSIGAPTHPEALKHNPSLEVTPRATATDGDCGKGTKRRLAAAPQGTAEAVKMKPARVPEKGARGSVGAHGLCSGDSSSACSTSFASGMEGGKGRDVAVVHPQKQLKRQSHKPSADSLHSHQSKSQVVNASPPAEAHADVSKRKRKAQGREEGTDEVNAGKGGKAISKHKAAGSKPATVKAPHWARGCKVLPCGRSAVPNSATSTSAPRAPIAQPPPPTLPLPTPSHITPPPLPASQSSSEAWQLHNSSAPNGLPVSHFWQYYAAFAAGYSALAQRMAPPAEGPTALQQGLLKQLPYGGYTGYPGMSGYPSSGSAGMGSPQMYGMGMFLDAPMQGLSPAYLGAGANQQMPHGPASWPIGGTQQRPVLNAGLPGGNSIAGQAPRPGVNEEQGSAGAFKTPPLMRLFHDASSRQHLVAAEAMR